MPKSNDGKSIPRAEEVGSTKPLATARYFRHRHRGYQALRAGRDFGAASYARYHDFHDGHGLHI